jgi:hypothetical protein
MSLREFAVMPSETGASAISILSSKSFSTCLKEKGRGWGEKTFEKGGDSL